MVYVYTSLKSSHMVTSFVPVTVEIDPINNTNTSCLFTYTKLRQIRPSSSSFFIYVFHTPLSNSLSNTISSSFFRRPFPSIPQTSTYTTELSSWRFSSVTLSYIISFSFSLFFFCPLYLYTF